MAIVSTLPSRPLRQAGSALVVSLIMLLIVTMIGVVAARGASQQTRMAANMTDRALAFQAAEAALREAEKWVSDLPPDSVPEPVATGAELKGAPVVWDLTALFETEGVLDWSADRWAQSGRSYSGTIAGVAAQPRFVIAYTLGGAGDAYFKAHNESLQNQMLRRGVQNFMILARGVGGTADSEVVLQAHVRKSIDK